MPVLNSLFSAFLMYSRIPMPQVEWKEENRRFALCFFPLVGVVLGGLFLGLWYLCSQLSVSGFLFGALGTALSVGITGGIHLDGFCDTQDGKACWGGKEKMLEVMADPHIGAFGAIRLEVYLLLLAGVYAQADAFPLACACALSFVHARAWSGLAAVTLKGAKTNGALQSFARPAHRAVTIGAELAWLAATGAGFLWLNPLGGLCGLGAGGLAFMLYRRFAYGRLGGATGDTAGYFLCVCELAVPMAFFLAGRAAELVT